MLTTAGLCGCFSCCPSPSLPPGSGGGHAVHAAAALSLMEEPRVTQQQAMQT